MNMSWGSLPRLVNLVGPAKAKRIVVLAERIDAERAASWGLADEIADDGATVALATTLARRAASLPPVAVRMCKQGIDLYANA
ncbi:enoyl-CoA hydratase/isomerase family protein, partial [Serratia marcescens]|uniref:enoyl-CoA hydratase/isomerase family protein n=1 Tax=Serratia marcescens TaxID=615 RepID=UPI001EF7B921